MTGASYQLSCDEQQALKQRVLAALRVQRLQQVRAQDRQLAKQRSRTFKDLCVESAQQLQAQLISLITQQREQELAVLKAQYEEALAGLATAQHQAAETEQQLAVQAQQRHELYLQRQAEAQDRFSSALAQVRTAKQSELQAALARVQRRQQVMVQERGKAHSFAEQAREAATRQAQRQAELNLQEEQRRRQNQVSRIDFKYSRLHELGMPHLVVNHRELPQQAVDAAFQAQQEAARLREEAHTLAHQQQENARKAADRGVSAQRLLQAEHNRRRMEQALQELESNELQQRKQDLAPDKLAAAPLLRKWHKQKLQAQAHRAFERDFIPGAAAAGQQGLPSFVAVGPDRAPEEQQTAEQHRPGSSPARRPATAADRALRLVKELERQRRAEAAAAAAERDQQRQRQQQQLRAAAARGAAAASVASTTESEVPVDDLITFIPPVSSAGGHEQVQTPTLAPEGTVSAAEAASVSSMGLTDLLEAAQGTSTGASQQGSAQTSSALGSMGDSLFSMPGEDAAAAQSEGSTGAAAVDRQQEPGLADSSVAAVASSASEVGEGSSATSGTPSSGTAADAAAGSRRAASPTASAALSSKDSLDAIIAAADEVLRQLPADMQAAAAARAAAAAPPIPQPERTVIASQQGRVGSQQQQRQPPEGLHESPEALRSEGVTSSSGLHQQPPQQHPVGPGVRDRPADSLADATAILAELRTLQQQLGLQALNPESEDSFLAELQQFDVDLENLTAQQLAAQPPGVQRAPLASAAARSSVGAADRTRTRPAAQGAAAPTELPPSSRMAQPPLQETRAGAAVQQVQQGSPQPHVRTELDELIDRILAPDYPNNVMLGPEPSTSSPTRSAGRSGRFTAAQDRTRLGQGQAPPAAPSAAGGVRANEAQPDSGASLYGRLAELGVELQALGRGSADGTAGVLGSSRSTSVIGGSSTEQAGSAGASTSQGESAASSSSLTLPTTILAAAARAGGQQQQQQQQQVPGWPALGVRPAHDTRGSVGGQDPRQRFSAVSVSTSAPSLSSLLQRAQQSLAAAAAAGQPGAAAAAVGPLGPLASSITTSDSSWSLSASQQASLLSLEQMLGEAAAAAEASAAAETAPGAAEGLLGDGASQQQGLLGQGPPSSAMSLPSTLLRGMQPVGDAGAAMQEVPWHGSSSSSSGAPSAPGGPAAHAAEQEQDQDPYSLLRGLLSLSDSSAVGSSPSDSSGAAAGAPSTMGPAMSSAGAGVGGVPVGGLLASTSISSALSSMSDRELDQLLQRAMAATGTAGPAVASAAAPGSAAAAAAMGLDAVGDSVDIEAALEAMLAAVPSAGAGDAGSLLFDQGSASLTIPSTVLRAVAVPIRQQEGGAVPGGQRGAAAAAAAAAGPPTSAAAALQRAKHSSRARAAEVSSGSGSSGSSVVSATSDSGGGTMGGSEQSSGDGASSGSLSLPPTLANVPGAGSEPDAADGGSNSAWFGGDGSSGLSLPHTILNAMGAAAEAAAEQQQQVAASGSSGLSLPSTVYNAMGAEQQQQMGAGGVSEQPGRQWQQQQQGGEQPRGADGLLTPIQEEDEASTTSASELLSASTQEIDALLSRLAHEQRQAGIAMASGSSGTVSETSSSSSGRGLNAPCAAPHSGRTPAADAGTGAGSSSGMGAGASSSSGRQDTMLSSDSFSEVVSSLMLHIDSTIASLAARGGSSSTRPATGDGGSSAARLTAAAGGSSAARPPRQPPQQQRQQTRGPNAAAGAAGVHMRPPALPSFSFGSSSSTSGTSSAVASSAPAAAAAAAMRGSRQAAAAGVGGGSGGDSSSSAAGMSVGMGSSSFAVSGVSGISSDAPTDSSTQRYVQQLLQGVLTSSNDGSPDQEAVSSRRQHHQPSAVGSGRGGGQGRGASAAAAAAAGPSRQHAAAFAAGSNSRAQGLQGGRVAQPAAAGAAASAVSSRAQLQQQSGNRLGPGPQSGGMLSPESTMASASHSSGNTDTSSGDTDELLGGMSSGSITIGPTSSSSSIGSGVQQLGPSPPPAAAPAAAGAGRQGNWQQQQQQQQEQQWAPAAAGVAQQTSWHQQQQEQQWAPAAAAGSSRQGTWQQEQQQGQQWAPAAAGAGRQGAWQHQQQEQQEQQWAPAAAGGSRQGTWQQQQQWVPAVSAPLAANISRGIQEQPMPAVAGPPPFGSDSGSAIRSALRAAAETTPSRLAFGELLSPDASSVESAGESRQTLSRGVSGGGASSSYVGHGAATAASIGAGTFGHGGGVEPTGPAAGAFAVGSTQQQQQQGSGGPVGLAGLLADIVADDPVLAQQLQQQGLGQQQQ